MFKRRRVWYSRFFYVIAMVIIIINCFIFAKYITNYEVNNQSFLYESDKAICETIHVGFVSTGYKQNLKVYILLKSLYFYRSKPLHFHVMVDDASAKVLKTLFQTWDVPQVTITYYNESKYRKNLTWPYHKNSFLYSNGYIKLLLSSIIPTSVTEKLIILDADLTFAADIYDLWKMFGNFNSKQAIGLAEEQTASANLPNYNTGVTLYHLKRLQEFEWHLTWTKIANVVVHYEQTQRDILNVIFNAKSKLIYNLPCEWNVQINGSAKTSNCFMKSKVKVIHRYFGNETADRLTKDENSFLSLHNMFIAYSGDIVRQTIPQCERNASTAAENSSPNPCSKFDEEIALNRRTLMFFRKFDYKPSVHDVTLVTQFSFEKLALAEHISTKWNGPISFAIYVSDYELEKCITFIENSKVLNNRSDIAYTAVFRKGIYYPINDLRNISMRTIVTPYIFLVDMDLIPSANLYENLKVFISNISNMTNKALVVPAFETKTVFPNNKQDVLNMLSNKTLKMFHSDYKKAYGPTDYEKWNTEIEPYTIKYQLYFEPYIVVNAKVAEFDRRFIGFGFNKASHALILDAQKYQFLVLPDVFVTHKFHFPSLGLRENKKSRLYRKCKIIRMKKFAGELNFKYNTSYSIKQ